LTPGISAGAYYKLIRRNLGVARGVLRLELVTRLVAIDSVTVGVEALYVRFGELALCLKSKDLLRAVVVAAFLDRLRR
jgi:hypothetical protein